MFPQGHEPFPLSHEKMQREFIPHAFPALVLTPLAICKKKTSPQKAMEKRVGAGKDPAREADETDEADEVTEETADALGDIHR